MLKGIDRAITADLLTVLMSVGHGDDLLICDVNHPAATIAKHTTHGRLVNMAGCDLPPSGNTPGTGDMRPREAPGNDPRREPTGGGCAAFWIR
jgi:hypothetical protein